MDDLLPPRRARTNWIRVSPHVSPTLGHHEVVGPESGETEEFLGRGDDVGLSLAAAIVIAHVVAQTTERVRIDPR